MTIAVAYWCILIAVLLPYLWTVIAKGSGEKFNNRDPRAWLARQENPRSRYANAAQLNSFENNPVMIAGVLMAQLAHVPESTIALCAVIYVIARILYGFFYISGLHYLRSLAWATGLVSVLYLIVQAALRVTAG